MLVVGGNRSDCVFVVGIDACGEHPPGAVQLLHLLGDETSTGRLECSLPFVS